MAGYRINWNMFTGFRIVSTCFLPLALTIDISAQVRDVLLTIHLRGVYESKISLLALSANKTFKPITGLQDIKNGATAKLAVSRDYLPGEFVLRFDYKEKESAMPYPSEKYIFIGNQDLELWANPLFATILTVRGFRKMKGKTPHLCSFQKKMPGKKKSWAFCRIS
jgi:hypothetical protein